MRHASFPATLFWGAILSFAFACGNNASAGKDSSAAPMTGSGSDQYFEFSVLGGSSSFTMKGSTKLYFSSGGKLRTEMQLTNSTNKNASAAAPIILIGSMDKPGISISIDEENKTYTINHVDDSATDLAGALEIKSAVSKVGEEEVAGYHCVHARIISTKDLRFMKQVDTIDLWRSTEVAFDPTFQKWVNLFEKKSGYYSYAPKAADQLKEIGCTGFPVKTAMHGKNSSMKMELIKVERRSLPGSLFEIPTGYKEEKDGL